MHQLAQERLLVRETLIERADANGRRLRDAMGGEGVVASLTRTPAAASRSVSTVARERSCSGFFLEDCLGRAAGRHRAFRLRVRIQSKNSHHAINSLLYNPLQWNVVICRKSADTGGGPGLDDPLAAAALKKLHGRAKRDGWILLRARPYGTWGEIRPEFEPKASEIVASEHWCSSGFANTDLDLQLKSTASHQLIVIGLIAHTCVEATVRFAAELGYEVTVVKDATAEYSDEEMHAALDINIPNYASAKNCGCSRAANGPRLSTSLL